MMRLVIVKEMMSLNLKIDRHSPFCLSKRRLGYGKVEGICKDDNDPTPCQLVVENKNKTTILKIGFTARWYCHFSELIIDAVKVLSLTMIKQLRDTDKVYQLFVLGIGKTRLSRLKL